MSEAEKNKLMSEIKFGEYIDKDLSVEEMKELFPMFTERFIKENEEYDLEGRLAELDWKL